MDTGFEIGRHPDSRKRNPADAGSARRTLFSPAFRTTLAIIAIVYIFTNAALKPIFLQRPSPDEVTWVNRSLSPWWFPHERTLDRSQWGARYGREYYYCTHHPSVTRIIYGSVLHLVGADEPLGKQYNYGATQAENEVRGNLIGYVARITLRVTNAAFTLTAMLLVFFGLLRIWPNRALAALAVVLIVLDQTFTTSFNGVIGKVGSDAVLLFMLVAFWFAWLRVARRGVSGAVVLGVLGGLATSTKLNGSFVLVAAIAYYLVAERGWRRLLMPLALGVTSVAVFILLNPIYVGGGFRWAWMVFHDTLTTLYKLQFETIGNPVNSRWLVTGGADLKLSLFPYLPFLVPATALAATVRREWWFEPTVFWSGAIIVLNLAGLVLFLPVYTVPIRAAFLILIAAASMARFGQIARWRRERAGGAAQDPPGSGAVEGPGSAGPTAPQKTAGPLRDEIKSSARPVGASAAGMLLVPLIAAAGLFLQDVPTQAFAAAILAVVFASAWMISGGIVKALVVSVTPAFMMLWYHTLKVAPMLQFVLAATILWLLYIYLSNPRRKGNAVAATALASVVAGTLSPQSAVLLVLVLLFYVVRPNAARRRSIAVALVAPFAFALLFQWFMSSFVPASPTGQPGWHDFSWRRVDLWNVATWSSLAHGRVYDRVVLGCNRWIWQPVAPALLVLAYPYRRQWWFRATFVGAAALVAGALLYGGNVYFQYSLPLEMGLLVPLGIVAALELDGEARQWRSARADERRRKKP